MADKLRIFKENRLTFTELYSDVMTYIKNVYQTEGREFTAASPFAQIVTVVLHIGRMILFYIENSITELNIATAFHERSIRGLATLTGHMPSMGVAARGTLYMSYNMSDEYSGSNITLKNYTKVINSANGLTYLCIFPSSVMKVTVGAYDSRIEIPVIQGNVKYQQATGTGEALQSFNFAGKGSELIDNFFINVYVNSKRWENVASIMDMSFNQEACMIRPSLNGGIDVFFGTGANGKVPEEGSTVLCEYIVTDGADGNITELYQNNYWSFSDPGYGDDGETVNLNSVYNLSSASQILFGTYGENIEMTRRLAPNASRSFVLANATNYKYFLAKLNMFSVIDAFSGFQTADDMKLQTAYEDAKNAYSAAKEKYFSQVNRTGSSSTAATDLYAEVLSAKAALDSAKAKYSDSTLDDNTIYLYLVPNIKNRIDGSQNYFTCSQDVFRLTTPEKNGIMSLIDDSGQQMVTVDNKIVDPIFVRFAINMFVQMWTGYDFGSVKSAIVAAVSDYLISFSRRDRIPVSDIVTLVEAVDGVDSVTVFFDADRNNATYYGEGNYGIDDYGDILLTRTMSDSFGRDVPVSDLLPLFRGTFTNADGIEYSDDIDSLSSTINITLRGTSDKTNA